ncbi:MAG: hypothetical protein CVV44_12070 [Spirochaetae bacterium HGW-Spirochaetae-1]|jgi:predicted secreted protein|nr:MAG: hypothetical protein CVV44_12070 [Spirochaetae bacterium HGW-Spirochaetae-1]
MIWNKKALTAYLYLGIPGVPKCGVYPSTESDVARINASTCLGRLDTFHCVKHSATEALVVE